MKTILKRLQSVLAVGIMAFGLSLGVVAAPAALAGTAEQCRDAKGNNISLNNGINCAKGQDQSDNLFGAGGVFEIITNVLLFLIGAIAVIMIIIGGIRYTVSGGDSTAVTNAKNTILYGVVGVVVAILAFAIVRFVVDAF